MWHRRFEEAGVIAIDLLNRMVREANMYITRARGGGYLATISGDDTNRGGEAQFDAREKKTKTTQLVLTIIW